MNFRLWNFIHKNKGANEQQIFKKIIFPLSLPGIITGTILILLQIVTNIIVPKYLGPTNVMVISELIENKIFLNDETKSMKEMMVPNSFRSLLLINVECFIFMIKTLCNVACLTPQDSLKS
ncbi:MAG: ABC transporter permease subunit [Candidatus Phytoplasma australasiaticum]|nr:ABC transporter permease subunit [Candidatus Phytoplasma australasiaticum]